MPPSAPPRGMVSYGIHSSPAQTLMITRTVNTAKSTGINSRALAVPMTVKGALHP